MHINTSILEDQPFLRGMAARQLELLAENSMPAEFKAGDTILSEGGPANRFYLIMEGLVELESRGLEGEVVRIQTIGTGDVLGWSWLFPPYRWHFSARTFEETRAIALDGVCLREKAETDHDFGYELVKRVTQIMMDRLQATRLQALDIYHVQSAGMNV